MQDGGKILGIDYGDKRVGLATSDDGCRISFPKEILSNDEHLFDNLNRTISSEHIKEIVVGESCDFQGRPNKIFKEIESFVFCLKQKFDLPIKMQKEFLTSVEARRYHDHKDRWRADASAAALILQRYLDKINKQ